VIYFLSKRSGSFNVWGIEFDSLRGRTVGSPFQITDFNTPHVQIAGIDRIGDSEIGVAGRRLVNPNADTERRHLDARVRSPCGQHSNSWDK
jgi:hypothetical protein